MNVFGFTNSWKMKWSLYYLFLEIILTKYTVLCTILESPDIYISSLGDDATLSCTVGNDDYTEFINWTRLEPSNYSQGGGVFCSILPLTGEEFDCFTRTQYDNFVSTNVFYNTNIFYLGQLSSKVIEIKISGVEAKDLGLYECLINGWSSWSGLSGGELALAVLPTALTISVNLDGLIVPDEGIETLSDGSKGVLEVTEGVETPLVCTAHRSKPKIPLSWTIDDGNEYFSYPYSSASYKFIKDRTHTSSAILDYTFNHALHHGMSVECFAYNEVANVTNTTRVTLNVLFSPIIMNLPEDNGFADKGDQVSLRCKVKGNPPANITWTTKNQVITGTEDHIELYMSDPDGFNRYSTLTLDSVDPDRDYGDYTCNATNTPGYDIFIINLDKKTMPEPATDVDVTDVADTKLTVIWTEGQDGGHPQTFTVQYRVDGSEEDWQDSRQVNQPPVTLGDLQPLTVYEVRIKSENVLGHVFSELHITNETLASSDLGHSSDFIIGVSVGVSVGCVLFISWIVFIIVFVEIKYRKKNKMEQIPSPEWSIAGPLSINYKI